MHRLGDRLWFQVALPNYNRRSTVAYDATMQGSGKGFFRAVRKSGLGQLPVFHLVSFLFLGCLVIEGFMEKCENQFAPKDGLTDDPPA